MTARVTVPALVVLVGLVLLHGFAPGFFLVDSTTIGLLVLIGVVVLATQLSFIRRYISELNIFGSGVKFREAVEDAAERAEILADRTREPSDERIEESVGSRVVAWPVFLEVPEHLRALVDVDPRLAIVGLGLEVERSILSLAYGTGLVPRNKPILLEDAAEVLRKHHRIDAEEEGLIATLIRLRGWALNGAEVTRKDARTFLDAIESLNDYSTGYSLNLSPNHGWEEQGLTCEFEHCIERMPLEREPTEKSCGFWAHNCPGGASKVAECAAKGLFDFPGGAYEKGKLRV